jgi:hypothetical protein
VPHDRVCARDQRPSAANDLLPARNRHLSARDALPSARARRFYAPQEPAHDVFERRRRPPGFPVVRGLNEARGRSPSASFSEFRVGGLRRARKHRARAIREEALPLPSGSARSRHPARHLVRRPRHRPPRDLRPR